MENILNKIMNRFLRLFFISNMRTSKKVVYLTFDDGPEPAICDFVLAELKKYNYKATFFCRGDNAKRYPELIQALRNSGHTIANHTYSHIHSYNMTGSLYADDVRKCDAILNTKLFRPPYGSLKLTAWLKLRKNYKIFFWSLNSGDSNLANFNFEKSYSTLKKCTRPGDIILFHFCKRHENETRELLPLYLAWLNKNGYRSDKI